MRWYYFLAFAFLILAYFCSHISYFEIDLQITQALQRYQNDDFRQLMQTLSWLGEPWIATATVTIFAVVLLIRKQIYDGLLIAFASLSMTLLSKIFKLLIARPRPDPQLVQQVTHYVLPNSFPSGHVLFFVGFYGLLIVLIKHNLKNQFLRHGLILFLALMIAGVGLSRIYLGAHWFTDVVGGYLLGIFWLICVLDLSARFQVQHLVCLRRPKP